MSIKGREGRLAATRWALVDLGTKFIEESFDSSMPQNQWLEAYGSKIYVRFYHHPVKQEMFDIANISIRQENQRQGIFTYFLTEMEKLCWSYRIHFVRVENVSHPGLARFLGKRGYQPIRDDGGLSSYEFRIKHGPPKI